MPGKNAKKSTKRVVIKVTKAKNNKIHAKGHGRKTRSSLGGYMDLAASVLPGIAGPLVGAASRYLTGISGSGAYKVNGNTLLNSPPVFMNSSTGMRVAHREYVCDLVGSVAFGIGQAQGSSVGPLNQLRLNPANKQLFPWLSQLAVNFEQYRWKGLVIEFKSTSGNAVSSTNAALGTVIMGTQYDVHDPPFSTKQVMDSYEYTTSTVSSCSSIHPVECSPAQDDLKLRYVAQTVPANSDQAFFDLGLFSVATAGMQADGNTVGELWVSYEAEFLKPRIGVNLGQSYVSQQFSNARLGTVLVLGAAWQNTSIVGSTGGNWTNLPSLTGLNSSTARQVSYGFSAFISPRVTPSGSRGTPLTIGGLLVSVAPPSNAGVGAVMTVSGAVPGNVYALSLNHSHQIAWSGTIDFGRYNFADLGGIVAGASAIDMGVSGSIWEPAVYLAGIPNSATDFEIPWLFYVRADYASFSIRLPVLNVQFTTGGYTYGVNTIAETMVITTIGPYTATGLGSVQERLDELASQVSRLSLTQSDDYHMVTAGQPQARVSGSYPGGPSAR